MGGYPHVVGRQGTPFRSQGCRDSCVAIRCSPTHGCEGDIGIRQEGIQLANVPSRVCAVSIPVQQFADYDSGQHDFLGPANDVGDGRMPASQLRIGRGVPTSPSFRRPQRTSGARTRSCRKPPTPRSSTSRSMAVTPRVGSQFRASRHRGDVRQRGRGAGCPGDSRRQLRGAGAGPRGELLQDSRRAGNDVPDQDDAEGDLRHVAVPLLRTTTSSTAGSSPRPATPTATSTSRPRSSASPVSGSISMSSPTMGTSAATSPSKYRKRASWGPRSLAGFHPPLCEPVARSSARPPPLGHEDAVTRRPKSGKHTTGGEVTIGRTAPFLVGHGTYTSNSAPRTENSDHPGPEPRTVAIDPHIIVQFELELRPCKN